jgi:hypothetical protein
MKSCRKSLVVRFTLELLVVEVVAEPALESEIVAILDTIYLSFKNEGQPSYALKPFDRQAGQL